MDIDILFEVLGKIIAYGGGSAAVAYLLFQYLGKGWIENKFNERLQQLQHQQNMEVHRLRVEIDSLLSGVVKLQEHEFEILPTTWKKLYKAQQTIKPLVSPLENYLKLDEFNEEQLEDALVSQEVFQTRLEEKGFPAITTEVFPAPEFYYAEHYHQQYLLLQISHQQLAFYCIPKNIQVEKDLLGHLPKRLNK